MRATDRESLLRGALKPKQMGRLAFLILAAALAGTRAVAQQAAPELVVESIGPDEGYEARVRQFDPERLRQIVQLVGLEQAGGPIRLVLAPESSEAARATPYWIAGIAYARDSTIVLFPSRSYRYPHDSLEAVLDHEVAHVLIGRAAHGRSVPRWFDEGLAVVAERTWGLEDRRQLAWALAMRNPPPLQDVETWFEHGAGEASRAYALAAAFVRYMQESHGSGTAARILERLAAGRSFDAAFRDATGESLDAAERRFERQITSWDRWIPLATSPPVLWMGVTLLAVAAILRQQRRRSERRRRLEDE